MRCKACDYELWHCTGRTCPECGTGFTLDEFEFDGEKVLFHCLHCDHGVVGTKPSGLPPIELEQCESCGLALSRELYIVRPIAGLPSSMVAPHLPIHGDEGSWFYRYFKTLGLVMSRPQNVISRVHVQKPMWDSWKFFLTTLLIMLTVGFIPSAFFYYFLLGGIPESEFPIIACMQIAVYFVVYIIIAVVWGLATHVLLQATGGSVFTLRRTMQAILYSSGVSLVGAVPCCGGLVSTVWWLVAFVNMVAKGQRVHVGRATFAVVTPPVLAILCVCGLYTFLISSAVSTARSAAISAQKQAQVTTTQSEEPIDTPTALPSN